MNPISIFCLYQIIISNRTILHSSRVQKDSSLIATHYIIISSLIELTTH